MLLICSILFISVVIRAEFPPIRRCKNTEFECDSGSCIPKSDWCGSSYYGRCSDRSDLKDCRLHYPSCSKEQTFCVSDKQCIPMKYACDGYSDCTDNSDEEECLKDGYRIRDIEGVVQSRAKAKIWFIRQLRPNYGWKEHTNRAITALSLSNTTEFHSKKLNYKLMIKQLQIELSGALLRNDSNYLPTYEKALYIHSLLAACLNPRKFQGYDLVEELQNIMQNSEFMNPLIPLAVCNSRGNVPVKIIHKLIEILQKKYHPQSINSQAYAALAIACLRKEKGTSDLFSQGLHSNISGENVRINNYTEISNIFKALQQQDGSFGNIYTTAVIAQAILALEDSNANWDIEKCFKYFISNQKKDGSFGNMLATYLIFPLMYGRTLVDLNNIHCSQELTNKGNGSTLEELSFYKGKKQKVEYMISIGRHEHIALRITLEVPSSATFYDVMRYAAELDNNFRFESYPGSSGQYIYSISGKVNDPESRKRWQLYKMEEKPILLNRSPDSVIPKDGEKYAYFYNTDNFFTKNETTTEDGI